MPKNLRFQPQANMIHVVSTRCLQGFLFLRPSAHVNKIIAGVLGRALSRFQDRIELHAYVFMSNHYHLILTAKDQQSLSQFMQYLNQNLSREIGRLHHWKNHLWQTNYASHLVLDEEGLVSQFKYILSNSVKEGLVSHPQLWPGLHCYSQIVERRRVKGLWIDRTRLYNAKRTKKSEHLTEDDFSTLYEIKLTRPEYWVHLSSEEYREMIKSWTQEICQAYKEQEFLGVKKVRESGVFVSRIPKAGHRPLCKAGCVQLWIEFKKAYREFRNQYYYASQMYRDALNEGVIDLKELYPSGGFIHGMVPT